MLPVAILVIVLAVALSGAAEAHSAGAVPPADFSRLLALVLVVGSVIAGIVFAAIVVGVRRFREGNDAPRGEPKVHDRNLELIWTVAPAVIVTVIAILSTQTLVVSEREPEGGIQIGVIGMQWQWIFTYPDGNTSIDDLWVEEGQVVKFGIESLDVVHSFFLPDFKLKVDAFPNITYETWIVAKPAGDYEIFCAEFCGLQHGEMRGTLHIFPKGSQARPYGPPPSEQPPPPPSSDVNATLSMQPSDGPSPVVPWTMQPSVLEFPLGARVHLRVSNNASVNLSVVVDPPYGIRVASIAPGTSVWLNFTADKPTAGEPVYCDIDDYREKGLQATMLVGVSAGHAPIPAASEGPPPWGAILGGGALFILAVVIVLALRPPSPPPGGKGTPHGLADPKAEAPPDGARGGGGA
jgi:heme/copper-type cytochrome/quinol oxidase subunit 2